MYENTVNLVGFVGQVNLYENEGKKPFAKLTLATTKHYTNKNGEKVEKTAWHTLQCFGHLIDAIKGRVEKGSYLSVSGELEYDEWQTEAGEKRTAAVISVKNLYRLIDPKLQEWIDQASNL